MVLLIYKVLMAAICRVLDPNTITDLIKVNDIVNYPPSGSTEGAIKPTYVVKIDATKD